MKVYRLFRHNECENFTVGYYASEKLAKKALKDLSISYADLYDYINLNEEKGVMQCLIKGYEMVGFAIEDIDVIEESN